MATQISHLRSGAKNQLLNPRIEYSKPPTSSHLWHSGSNHKDVEQVWNQVTAEHPEKMKVRVKGIEIDLKAIWSLSGKSVSYNGYLSKEDLREKFFLEAAKNGTPSISIQHGSTIVVHNGKNSFIYICPSLIEIID